MPYVEYAVFKDYIAKNLCINKDKPKSCCEGKCYLEKQVKKSTETSEAEDKGSNRKVISQEVNEFIASSVSIPKATEIIFSSAISSKMMITKQIDHFIFVPPKTFLNT